LSVTTTEYEDVPAGGTAVTEAVLLVFNPGPLHEYAYGAPPPDGVAFNVHVTPGQGVPDGGANCHASLVAVQDPALRPGTGVAKVPEGLCIP